MGGKHGISGFTVNESWHLNSYRYGFYKFPLESLCRKAHPKMLLDAGCGSRISSLSEIPSRCFVVAEDIDRSNAVESHRKAKVKGYRNLNYVVASLTHLPLKSEVFDVAVSADVLEHVSNKRRAISEIARVTKKHGSFIGSTSNLQNPIMLLDTHLSWLMKALAKKYAGEKHYQREGRLSQSQLAHELNRNFTVSSLQLYGFPPFQPWIYENTSKPAPWYSYIWIIFDKLTRYKPLRYLKEMIVWSAIKKP